MAGSNKSLLLAKKKGEKKEVQRLCVCVYVCMCICVFVSTDVGYMLVPCVRGWEFLSYLRLLCSCPELIAVPSHRHRVLCELVCVCVCLCVGQAVSAAPVLAAVM